MAYALAQDYINYYGDSEATEATNLDSPDAIAPEETVLTEYLERATGEINSYLAVRYSVPVSPTTEFLKYAACVIARKNLDRYQRREHVQRDYDDLIKQLIRIGKGDQALLDDSGNPIDQSDVGQEVAFGAVGYAEGQRTFSQTNLQNYQRTWSWF